MAGVEHATMSCLRSANLQRSYDDTDRWINNVFIQRVAERPESPKARWVKRKPVSVRALHRVKPDPIFGFDPPVCVDPAWSNAQTIAYWDGRL
jgi:hypothetical protein